MSRVDRKHLQQDGVRNAVRAAGQGHLLLSDEAMAKSLADTLARKPAETSPWIFAYGSLVWNPTFQFAERRVARAYGYHRGFYLWSRINRGTAEIPGLVLGLDRGGHCNGIAYRLDPASAEEDLRLLWRREMVVGSYRPCWLTVRVETGVIAAIAFVIDRSKPNYAGRLTDERIVAVALQAHGHYGSCADYLVDTADALASHGIADRNLDRLARRVRAGRA